MKCCSAASAGKVTLVDGFCKQVKGLQDFKARVKGGSTAGWIPKDCSNRLKGIGGMGKSIPKECQAK